MNMQGHTTFDVTTEVNQFVETQALAGPSVSELEYLQQLVSELEIFLRSSSVSTIRNIYLGFYGNGYRGQMLMSRGA